MYPSGSACSQNVTFSSIWKNVQNISNDCTQLIVRYIWICATRRTGLSELSSHWGHYLLYISFSSGASPKVDAGGLLPLITMPLFAGFPLSAKFILEKCIYIVRTGKYRNRCVCSIQLQLSECFHAILMCTTPT